MANEELRKAREELESLNPEYPRTVDRCPAMFHIPYFMEPEGQPGQLVECEVIMVGIDASQNGRRWAKVRTRDGTELRIWPDDRLYAMRRSFENRNR